MSRQGLFIAAIAAVSLGAGPRGRAADAPLFSEDFESESLAQWVGRGGGKPRAAVAEDPLHVLNHVLAFTSLNADSDVFGPVVKVQRGEKYLLHFDYLGRWDLPPAAGQDVELGGTIGFTDDPDHPQQWLAGSAAGTSGIPKEPRLVDDGLWHTYDIVFDPYATSAPAGDTIRLVLEKLVTSQAVPGDPFFDNIQLTRQASSSGGCSYAAAQGAGVEGRAVFLLVALAGARLVRRARA
jgi:hypothetical protein